MIMLERLERIEFNSPYTIVSNASSDNMLGSFSTSVMRLEAETTRKEAERSIPY